MNSSQSDPAFLFPGDLVLFQGDSITDAFRKPEESNHAFRLGNGFALIVAARLLSEYPSANYRFENRGVSGSRIGEMRARWQQDCLDLRPHVVSLLIGVNDSANPGTDPAEYQDHLAGLIAETRRVLPEVRFILGEPFLLPVGGHREERFEKIARLQAAVALVASQVGALHIPFQSIFDKVSSDNPAYWVYDGIHPTAAGFGLMADAWLAAVSAAPDLITPIHEERF